MTNDLRNFTLLNAACTSEERAQVLRHVADCQGVTVEEAEALALAPRTKKLLSLVTGEAFKYVERIMRRQRIYSL